MLVEEHAETELVKASEDVAARVRDVAVQAHEVRAREGGLIKRRVNIRRIFKVETQVRGFIRGGGGYRWRTCDC